MKTPTTTEYIYLIKFLETDQAAQVLLHKRNAIVKRKNYRETPYTNALWQGFVALRDKARDNAQELTRDGKLLFGFPGTTVLSGVAA